MSLPTTIPIIGLPWDDVLFLLLAGGVLGFGLLVVTLRDIIRCGLAMIVCFACLAGIYVIAGAPLVAAAQVLVYMGAISVLVLFAVMLTQTKVGPSRLVFQTQAAPAAVACVILAIVLALGVTATDWGDDVERIWTDTRQLATVLFTEYILAFEVVSVLLLAAVVGGIFLAKRDRATGGD
jgi:NADH:ubiquinone oxidoreductase subunit 6 (subunit J)